MVQKVNLYVDESYLPGGMVLIALVSVDNGEYETYITEKLRDRRLARPYLEYAAAGHHVEDHFAIRSDMANWVLRTAPLSAYFLARNFDPSPDETTAKRRTYREMFPKVLLSRVITKYKKLNDAEIPIDIAFENLTDKHNSDLDFFSECVNSLGHKNVSVRVITKDNPLTTLPDYMAGILRACIKEGAGDGSSTAERNARMIQEKVGLIAVCPVEGDCKYYERGDEVQEFIKAGCPCDI